MNPPDPQQQGAISLSQLRANPELHSEADEQTQIRIEKGIVEEELQTYFSGPDYRIILDDEPPTLGYRDVGTNKTVVYTLPAANVALYRVEMTDYPPAIDASGVQGSIHSLHLYVHAGDPCTLEALVQSLEIIMKNTDEDDQFFTPGAAWAVLSWGLKVSFFKYTQGSLEDMTLEDLVKEFSKAYSPEIEPMD